MPRISPCRRTALFAAMLACGVMLTASAQAAVAPSGQPGYFTERSFDLGDGTGVAVDVASGNLRVTANDLTAATDTYNVTYSRSYNSRFAQPSGILGAGWSLSVGPQISITPTAAGVRLDGPNGFRTDLTDSNNDGIYEGPLTDGTLTAREGGGWDLQVNASDTDYLFDTTGQLTSLRTLAGTYTQATTSAGGHTVLSSYGTTDGRRINVSYTGDARINEIDDPASNHRSYTYDPAGHLTGYQGPSGTATYGYNPAGLLSQVTLPSGGTASVLYTPDGRVASLTTQAPGASAQSTTLTYTGPSTTVTDPDSTSTTYTHDADGLATESTTSAAPPALSLTGTLPAAAGTILTADSYTLHVDSPGADSIAVSVGGSPVTSGGGPSLDTTLDPGDDDPGRSIVTISASSTTGIHERSFAIDIPAVADDPNDGTVAGEADFTPDDEATYGIQDCEAAYGSGSQYCIEPAGFDQDTSNPAPALMPLTSRTAFAPLSSSTSTLIYGISDEDAAWGSGWKYSDADHGPDYNPDWDAGVRKASSSYLDNPLFTALKVKRVRKILPWNVMSFPEETRAFSAYYKKAIDAGKDIMVSFQFGLLPGVAGAAPRYFRDTASGQEDPPAKATWTQAMRAFKARFPRVVSISAWNEPSELKQPTNNHNGAHGGGPKRAARYTYWLERYVCAPFRRSSTNGCRAIAGDLAPSIAYVAPYKRELDRLFAQQSNPPDLVYPTYWGVHPYSDVRARRGATTDTLTHRFIKEINHTHNDPWDPSTLPKHVWITEAGAHTQDHLAGNVLLPDTQQQAAQVTYLVNKLATMSDSIERLYYYSFCPGTGPTTDRDGFDTGLTERIPTPSPPTDSAATCSGTPRPAYTAYKSGTVRNPNG